MGEDRGTLPRTEYNRSMEPAGIVVMILVLGGIWGGFGFFLYRTLHQDE